MYRRENNRLELYNAAVDAGWIQVKNLPSTSLRKLIDTGDRSLDQIMKYSDRATIQNTLSQFYKIPLRETRKLNKKQLQNLLQTNYAKDGIIIPNPVLYPRVLYPPSMYPAIEDRDVSSPPNPVIYPRVLYPPTLYPAIENRVVDVSQPPPLPPPTPPSPPLVNLRSAQPRLQQFMTRNNYEIDQNTFRSLV